MIYGVTGVLLLLATLVVWVMIQQRKNFFVLFILAPLFVFGVGYSWYAFKAIQGYPVHTEPTEGILMSGYENKPYIYLLVANEKEPRLYAIEWTEKNSRLFNRAKKRIENGEIVIVGIDLQDKRGEQIQYKQLDPSEHSPKKGSPRQ